MDNVGSAACGIASDQAHQGLRQLDELGPSALSSLMGYLSRSWDPAPIQDLDAPARRNLQQQRVRYAALDLQEPIEKIARQTQGRGPTEHFRNIVELINVRDSARLRQLLAQRRTDDVHVRDLQRATPEARCFSMQLGLLLQQPGGALGRPASENQGLPRREVLKYCKSSSNRCLSRHLKMLRYDHLTL